MTIDQLVAFECVSTEVGDHCDGVAGDGTRVTCRVEGCRWWVGTVLKLARLVGSGRLAGWAVGRGIEMKVVANWKAEDE